MNLIQTIRDRAKDNPRRIVLPEGTEERTLRAADIILEEGLAHIILLGNVDEMRENAGHWGLKHIHKATCIDPLNHPRKQYFADMLYELRKTKGMTPNKHSNRLKTPCIWQCCSLKTVMRMAKLPAQTTQQAMC